MRAEPGVSIKATTLAPRAFTLSTSSTISLVFPETEEYTSTDWLVNRRFPVVRNSAAFSAYTGRAVLPRRYTSACSAEAQVPPMPMYQMPSKPSSHS